jgi:hypothetical protein
MRPVRPPALAATPHSGRLKPRLMTTASPTRNQFLISQRETLARRPVCAGGGAGVSR